MGPSLTAAAAAPRIGRCDPERFATGARQSDPYDFYRELRSLGSHVEVISGHAWALTTYSAVQGFIRDGVWSHTGPPGEGDSLERETTKLVNGSIPFLDGKEHREMRALFRMFSDKSVIDATTGSARSILASILPSGLGSVVELDLCTDLAMKITIPLVADAFSLPTGRVAEMVGPASVGITGLDPAFTWPPGHDEHVAQSLSELYGVVGDFVDPSHDDDTPLLDAMANRARESERLSDTVYRSALFIFSTMLLTPAAFIANAVVALTREPGQVALLRSDRSDPTKQWANAVEELLRYDPPFHMTTCFATEDFEIDGFRYDAGSMYLPMLASANRDESRYEEPDRLSFDRSDPAPASFGGGVHTCLGQAMARALSRVVLGDLTRDFDVELLGPPEYVEAASVRAPTKLPVRLTRIRTAPRGPEAIDSSA